MLCIKIIYDEECFMNNFNDYAKNQKQKQAEQKPNGMNESAFDMLKRVARQYEGASEQDLISAIIKEANRSRKNGTLSDVEIQNFVNTISPMLNEKQRKQLAEVVNKIKN